MKNISWINYLKLRLSWGKNGNRGIDSYTSLSNMDLTQFVYGDGGSSSIGLYPILYGKSGFRMGNVFVI